MLHKLCLRPSKFIIQHLIYNLQGKCDSSAEGYHTVEQNQQEASQAVLHKGTQGVSSVSLTELTATLGPMTTAL